MTSLCIGSKFIVHRSHLYSWVRKIISFIILYFSHFESLMNLESAYLFFCVYFVYEMGGRITWSSHCFLYNLSPTEMPPFHAVSSCMHLVCFWTFLIRWSFHSGFSNTMWLNDITHVSPCYSFAEFSYFCLLLHINLKVDSYSFEGGKKSSQFFLEITLNI